MQFNSPVFLLLFLPCFMLVYFLAGPRAKLWLGVLGSLIFYAWGQAAFLPLILGLMLATYVFARGVSQWADTPLSTISFWLGIFLSLGVLVASRLAWPQASPLGLSYLTF